MPAAPGACPGKIMQPGVALNFTLRSSAMDLLSLLICSIRAKSWPSNLEPGFWGYIRNCGIRGWRQPGCKYCLPASANPERWIPAESMAE